MSNRAMAITVSGIGKQYRLGQQSGRHNTLRDSIAATLRSGLWRRGEAATTRFWALRDVSFEVAPGEAIGIIGANGAGKSTLLKILARITEPTEGMATVRGRVGSLLEVGTGFHSELTGRENTYLSGAILGMRREEIDRKFDDIIEFAGLERFVDTPVKHYSSGMYLRLAFSVAAHLEPQILIVDEVLAVGDAEFQRKCLGKMEDVTHREGRTVCFVSHSLAAVQRLCDRAIVLDRGRLVGDGTPAEMIALYQRTGGARSAPGTWIDLSDLPRAPGGTARFTGLLFSSDDPAAGDMPYMDGPLRLLIEINADHAVECPSLAAALFDAAGTSLVNADILAHGRTLQLHAGRNVVEIRIDALHLKPGTYRLGLWMANMERRVLDRVQAAIDLEVHPAPDSTHRTFPGDGSVSCSFSVVRHS